MEYVCLTEYSGELERLQRLYKEAVGEDAQAEGELDRLARAVREGRILFYGCRDGERLVACCSVCVTFSTFNYLPGGVFEDFYILPEYRGLGIARRLARFAYEKSGVSSLTVGCADCDAGMYNAIGFSVRLGSLLAYGGEKG